MTDLVNMTTTNIRESPYSPKQRSVRPAPIDINLAQAMRTLSLLPRKKSTVSPISSSSDSSSSISPVGNSKRTPLYIHIYAQMRSPASSTPFPILVDTPAKVPVPPNTAIFQPPVTDTPTSSSSYSSAYTDSWYSPQSTRSRSIPMLSFSQTNRQATDFPFARSKRLEMLRKILVDPIDTDTQYLGRNPKWFRMRTPIAGRWNLFQRSSQLRLARLAEDAWYYGEEDSPDMPGSFASESGSGSQRESIFKANEDQEDSANGWNGLPVSISPLEDEMRRVASGKIW